MPGALVLEPAVPALRELLIDGRNSPTDQERYALLSQAAMSPADGMRP